MTDNPNLLEGDYIDLIAAAIMHNSLTEARQFLHAVPRDMSMIVTARLARWAALNTYSAELEFCIRSGSPNGS